MKKILLPIIILTVIVTLIFSSTGCKKDHSPKATITVILEGGGDNGEDIPLEGAIVTVYVDPSLYDTTHENYNAYIDAHQDSLVRQDQQITDEYGQTHHTFHYESILHVEAKYGFKKNDTIYGFGAIILEEDKTYEEIILLKR